MNRQSGMTMVELMVSLAVVMLVIGTATTAYLKLLRTYKIQGRLAESYMANLTGLELLRFDIEMAGFGLPASLGAFNYQEAAARGNNNPAPPYDPQNAALNDATTNAPRAFGHLDGINSSDVLAIKSCSANVFNNPTGRKWSLITNPLGNNPTVKRWGDAVMDLAAGDYFIAVDDTGKLLTDPVAPPQWTNAFNVQTVTGGPGVPTQKQVFYMYGIDTGGAHRMPFNRVDYYLDNNINFPAPRSCANGTFTLYRSTINQQNGQLQTAPLIDCVKDFQVAFGLDPSAGVNPAQAIVWQNNLAGLSALQIRQQLREVRVFLLYQEGPGDVSKSPDFRFSGTLNLGDQDIANSLDTADYPANAFQQWSSAALPGSGGGSPPQLNPPGFTPAGNDLQYRWKIIEMAVKPMNLRP